MKVEAIVLAGASNRGALGSVSDASHEALILLEGRPMIDYVIDALRASPSIARILVVGPAASLAQCCDLRGVELCDAGGSLVENLQIGIERLNPTGPVLVVTSDIPLIHPEAVEDFVRRCEDLSADIYYPIVSKEVNEARFPGMRRTYVRLKEGTFTGGNLVLLRPEIVASCRDMIAQAVAMRKNPLQLSRLLGFAFILKLLFNRLTLREIEERVRLILGFRGVAIISPYPEVGIDVDKPEDLRLVEAALKARKGEQRATE